MRLEPLIFVVLFFSPPAISFKFHSQVPQFDDEGNDCCKLEWSPIIQVGVKHFIPSTAIVAGTSPENGTNWYYIRKPNIEETGIVSDVVTDLALFVNYQTGAITKEDRSGGFILANPNKCIIGWRERIRDVPFRETTQIQFPRVNFRTFSFYKDRYSVGLSYENGPGTRFYGIWLTNGQYLSLTYLDNVLYVDCQASLMNILTAELHDMKIAGFEGMKSEKDHESVASTTIVNDSELEQKASVSLNAQVSSSLEMYHDTQLHSVAETKWGVDTSLNLQFIERFIFWKAKQEFSVHGHYDSYSLKENFTKFGSIRFESTKNSYSFNQAIRTQGNTVTKVSIQAQPVKGSKKFTAYYKLYPKLISAESTKNPWTSARILGSLQRIGFRDFERIKHNTSDDSLTIAYEGTLSIDAGYNTRVLIESKPINASGTPHLEYLELSEDSTELTDDWT